MTKLSNPSQPIRKMVIFGIGYLGGRMASEALARGWQVSGLTRNEETARKCEAQGVKVHVANLESDSWHRELPCDVDAVVNCISAGSKGRSGYQASYLDGMRSILAWAEGGFRGRMLYTSSTSVYPYSEGERVDESMSLEGHSASGALLRQAEVLLEESGLPQWMILRLAGLYGPGRHYLVDRIRQGVEELPGSGDSYLNLIHVEDVCRALWAGLDGPDTVWNRIYNLSDNAPSLKREVVAWVAGQYGKPVPRFNPDSSIRPRRLPNGKMPNRRIVSDRFFEALSWRPQYRDYREGYGEAFGFAGSEE